jgi:hypothetical protein
VPSLGAVPRVEGPLPDHEHGLLEPRPPLLGVLVRAPAVPSRRSRLRTARDRNGPRCPATKSSTCCSTSILL